MLTLTVKAFDKDVPETHPQTQGDCLALLSYPAHYPGEQPPVRTGYVWQRVLWTVVGGNPVFQPHTRTPIDLHGWEVVAYTELPDPDEYPWLEVDGYPVPLPPPSTPSEIGI